MTSDGRLASTTTIDSVKDHDAPDEDDAAWHIGVFLWWCAERGLAMPQHTVESLRRDATAHVIESISGKLWASDLTPEGAAFAQLAYPQFTDEITDLVYAENDGGDASMTRYDIAAHPAVEEFREALFELLDDLLEAHRARTR